MGIDAKMLVIVEGSRPSDKQVAIWGDMLCRSIGAKKFFASDGIPPKEYQSKNNAWHEAFNSHPMYKHFNLKSITHEKRIEARDKIIADIGECPQQLQRAIEFTHTGYSLDEEDYPEEDYPGLTAEFRVPGKCWIQDGDPIFAVKNEWFLEVNLWTRYYGVGYERGDLMTICAVAEWCELNIPNCEVWYGGDSSGVLAAPFPEFERTKLKKHSYSQHGRDYYDQGMFGKFARESDKAHPEPCGLCIGAGSFSQYGSGSQWSAVHCASCGKSFETRDQGQTWTKMVEKDRF